MITLLCKICDPNCYKNKYYDNKDYSVNLASIVVSVWGSISLKLYFIPHISIQWSCLP